MKRIAPLLTLVAALAVAGCQDTPLATPPEDAARSSSNQPPVAVIVKTSQKPLAGSPAKMRMHFSGTSSYDPDGTIVQYYWYPQSHCGVAPGYGTTFYMDVPADDPCGLTLYVTDNENATGYTYDYYGW